MLIMNDKENIKEEKYIPFLSLLTVFYLREFSHSPTVSPSN